MSSNTILQRLRVFLLALSAFMLVGVVIELVLSEHTEEPAQFLPFILCGLGMVAILATLVRPQRLTLRALQAVMVVVVLGSLFGIYEHLESNVTFELDMRPGAVLGDVIVKALIGAAPLLAPGMLAMAAAVALAATYYHPALAKTPDPALALQSSTQPVDYGST